MSKIQPKLEIALRPRHLHRNLRPRTVFLKNGSTGFSSSDFHLEATICDSFALRPHLAG